MFSSDGVRGFFTGFYNTERQPRWHVDIFRDPLEILPAARQPRGIPCRIEVARDSLLPYLILKKNTAGVPAGHSVRVALEGETRRLGGQMAERFYYLPVKGGSRIELSSDNDLAVGSPIPLIQEKQRKKRLVLVLFLDGLSGELFRRHPLSEVAPNIHRFFSKGAVFENCYSTSDWSLPGLGSLFSGLRVGRHRLLHPNKDAVIGDGYPILSESFQQDGYLTFQACGNWRKTPSYGFVKGFDRTVYKRQLSLMEVDHAFFEHLRAFPRRDNFAWLTYFDLHHIINDVPDVGAQAGYTLAAHDYARSEEKSILRLNVDEPAILRYVEELRRIDFHLGLIFSHIEKNYSDEEMLVCLVSDHGTSYLSEDSKILARERTHVPFMLRGGGIPSGLKSREWVQNVDILPTLLRSADIPFEPGRFDGDVPRALGGTRERDHVLCESVFPGSTYKATVKDEAFDFYLETKGRVDDEGDFDLSEYTTDLFKPEKPNDSVLKENPGIAKKYEEILLAFLGSRRGR